MRHHSIETEPPQVAPLDFLGSAHAHMTHHQLGDTWLRISDPGPFHRGQVQVGKGHSNGECLQRWLPTLADATMFIAAITAADTVHIALLGSMIDGTPVYVIEVVDVDHFPDVAVAVDDIVTEDTLRACWTPPTASVAAVTP